MSPSTLSILIHVFLIAISMMWVNWDFIKNHKEFLAAIKGKDKILQVTEICIYVWVRLFPLVILVDLFLDYKISPQAWYSLDAIFFILIVGDLGHKYLDKK